MKQRFTFLDIRAVVNELQTIPTNTYIQNVYSINNKTYVFKLSSKHFILVEIGVRLHLISQSDFDNLNSGELTFFCTKIRQLLKRQQLAQIKQVGFDRIVVFELSNVCIYFEFFAAGNLVICDKDYVVKLVYRPVKEIELDKGSQYVFNNVELDFSYNMFKAGFKDMVSVDKIVFDDVQFEFEKRLNRIGYSLDKDLAIKKLDCSSKDMENNKNSDYLHGNSNIDNEKGINKNICSLEIKNNEIHENDKNSDFYQTDKELKKCYDTFFEELLDKLANLKNYGLLISVKKHYNNFIPYKISKIPCESKVFPTFNEAVAQFYRKEQKVVAKKSTTVQQKQEKRMAELEKNMDLIDLKVKMLLENYDVVCTILEAHKNVLNYKLDWNEFEKYKSEETALLDFIKKSDFKNEKVVLKFETFKEQEDDEEEKDKRESNLLEKEENSEKNNKQKNKSSKSNKTNKNTNKKHVEVDLDISFNLEKNIARLYDTKKKLQEKLKKRKKT
ncbi:hypothetical protein EDEG_01191 [Edhazardia aedis USNM 41457]|uniref:Uncharacterized protein n=1 Tax=Edhazardia aedis (strain USNM 41457) TaxID=1003232 RepID=J9DTK7_EDHAE|nr:hypothetical protein EDEG_01191 [Edhazardia aedis USNM 41457]|eukprot:EJW04607.1 hypothetical protein EDEG_01191 [Edhazardia aedis USNM 41457]